MKAFVYFIRGQGGRATSPGVDVMANEVASWPGGPQVATFDWNQWQAVLADLRAYRHVTALRIVVGYSLGADAVTWEASGVQGVAGFDGQIDLLVALDPSVWTVVSPLHANVKDALVFKNDNPANIVGLAAIPLGGDFLAAVRTGRSKYRLIHTLLPHLEEDIDPYIQRTILGEIRTVLGLPA